MGDTARHQEFMDQGENHFNRKTFFWKLPTYCILLLPQSKHLWKHLWHTWEDNGKHEETNTKPQENASKGSVKTGNSRPIYKKQSTPLKNRGCPKVTLFALENSAKGELKWPVAFPKWGAFPFDYYKCPSFSTVLSVIYLKNYPSKYPLPRKNRGCFCTSTSSVSVGMTEMEASLAKLTPVSWISFKFVLFTSSR